MKNGFITTSSAQTKKLGKMLAEELKGGEIICLSGDLGTGKTTFTQGFLRGLGIKDAITSPTFAILKQYKVESIKYKARNSKRLIHPTSYFLQDVYHIDAYRINSKDLLDLGWKDFAGKPDSIVIIEWAERVKKLIPSSALWIKFEWIDEKERKISFNTK